MKYSLIKGLTLSKIGIYSGTFDPVHDGHLAFAKAAIRELSLDILYMLAEPVPWRKQVVTPLEHRQKMLELAVAGNPKIRTKLEGMNDQHDIESSLKAFEDSHPNDKIVLLMGVDVFMNIDKWQGWGELKIRTSFAVGLRTEDDGEELVYKLIELKDVDVTKIVTDKSIVTSSSVREAVKAGETPKNVSPEVADYIAQNSLYA
jgi:nicotinate-nucleotide adenylyltransferase